MTSLSFSIFTKVWPLLKYLCDITLAVSLLFSGFLFSCSNKCATYSNHFRRNCNKSTPRKRYLLGLANQAVALCCGANYSLGSASRHQIKCETVICPSVWPLYATKSYWLRADYHELTLFTSHQVHCSGLSTLIA